MKEFFQYNKTLFMRDYESRRLFVFHIGERGWEESGAPFDYKSHKDIPLKEENVKQLFPGSIPFKIAIDTPTRAR